MQLIQNNPYRTVGILAGATAAEQRRQLTRLQRFLEADQEPENDFSFPVIGEIVRTVEIVTEAASKLNLDSDKINAALFWFWNGNSITDEVAFDALKEGNIEKAYRVWDSLITDTKEDGKRFWKPVTEKNYSAFHNCSLLNLTWHKGSFHNRIVAKLYFLESDLAHKFVSVIAGETYKKTKTEIQLLFLNQVQSEIENKDVALSNQFFEIIKKQEFEAKTDFMAGFVQKPIEQIEKQIEETKNKRKANKAEALKIGEALHRQTSENTNQLKLILGVSNVKYSLIADKLASEILQCSIDFFNDSQDRESNTDYAQASMKLAKQAEAVAVGSIIKDRIRENIASLEGMKDKEILQAIQALQSVKDAYDEACKKIDKQVDDLQYYDGGNFSDGTFRVPNINVSIDWVKVAKMKQDAIDWDKVVELIQSVISHKNVEKIKNTSKQSQLNEYKTLADFLVSKLSFSQVNRVKYICYWKTENAVSNVELTVQSLPLWAKWCLGIALFLIIVAVIWGKEGIQVIFCIAGVLGILALSGWLQNLNR